MTSITEGGGPGGRRGEPRAPGPGAPIRLLIADDHPVVRDGLSGMLTADREFLDRARILSLHGMSRDAWRRYARGGSWKYDVVAPGFKYNMTDIQAALGLAQLRKLDRFQQRRREVVDAYNAAFGGSDAPTTTRPSAATADGVALLPTSEYALKSLPDPQS